MMDESSSTNGKSAGQNANPAARNEKYFVLRNNFMIEFSSLEHHTTNNPLSPSGQQPSYAHYPLLAAFKHYSLLPNTFWCAKINYQH